MLKSVSIMVPRCSLRMRDNVGVSSCSSAVIAEGALSAHFQRSDKSASLSYCDLGII